MSIQADTAPTRSLESLWTLQPAEQSFVADIMARCKFARPDMQLPCLRSSFLLAQDFLRLMPGQELNDAVTFSFLLFYVWSTPDMFFSLLAGYFVSFEAPAT